jgi:anti-sigma regulatory factor (Ser/Thr protein kinase)
MPTPAPDASDDRSMTGLGPIEYRFAPSLPAIRLARHVLSNWLELQPGVNVDGIDDLLVACSELVTNAVRHATGSNDQVALRVFAAGDSIVFEVEDDGDGFAWPVSKVMADVLADDENGRGLFIVEALTDDVEVVASRGRTIVRCLKRGMLNLGVAQTDAADADTLSARFRAESHPADSNR